MELIVADLALCRDRLASVLLYNWLHNILEMLNGQNELLIVVFYW